MARRRSPPNILLAALTVLLLGLGPASAALACPVAFATTAEPSQVPRDHCDHSAINACVQSCGVMCQSLMAAEPDAFSPAIMAARPVCAPTSIGQMECAGPDPPPPRAR